jgi:hypothetical protein
MLGDEAENGCQIGLEQGGYRNSGEVWVKQVAGKAAGVIGGAADDSEGV